MNISKEKLRWLNSWANKDERCKEYVGYDRVSYREGYEHAVVDIIKGLGLGEDIDNAYD